MPGQNALVRYGFSREEHVPGPMPHFPKWASEEFVMDRPPTADPNIDPSGNETEGENLEAAGTFTLSGAPDSESYVPMRSHQHGFYEQSSPAGGVHLYELRDFDVLNDDPVAHYMGSLTFGIWRDVIQSPAEYIAQEAKVATFRLTAAANDYVRFEHSGLYLRDTYMKLPEELAVNAAYTGGWVERGHRVRGDETGPDIAYKVSTAGAIGVAKLKFGTAHDIVSLTSVGTTATATTDRAHGLATGNTVTVTGATPAEYNVTAAITVTGATTFTYVIVSAGGVAATGTIIAVRFGATEYLIVDDWMDVYKADGTFKGTRGEPVQIRPTPETGDLFTLDDTWRIGPRGAKPIGTVSARGKLKATEMELEFTIGGGVAFRKVIQNFTMEHGTPWEVGPGLGSKYHQSIDKPENARNYWEVTFDRELKDLDFELARVSGARVSAYAKFYGSAIGSTGLEDYAEYFIEAASVTNAGGTVTSPGKTPESVTLRAFPASAGASLCVERYQNTVASIDPT